MKKCIYHYPRIIAENPMSGSEVRPNRMLKAFKELGYDVEEVTGFSKERARKIKELKKQIREGVKFDFVYAESTSMPTALSDPDHLPRHPLQDELFFKYCRSKGIPVGLFYRDAYWKFPLYKKETKWWTPIITKPFYQHELKSYMGCTDILFVPSNEFAKAIGYNGRYKELPPGNDAIENENLRRQLNTLNIFYVGGMSGLYDLTMPLRTLSSMNNVHLTICCSKGEWNSNEMARNIVGASNNIDVVHKTKNELGPYYANADVAMVFFERNAYRDLAMPVKLFEYIGYRKPVIATAGTAAGRYVTENNIGWAIDYDSKRLKELLERLGNSSEISDKEERLRTLAQRTTWEARAETVAKELLKQI